jgi:hypothetical protein
MTGGGRPSQRQKVIASLFYLSLRAERGNPGKQNSKSEIRNTKQYQMTKIPMTEQF